MTSIYTSKKHDVKCEKFDMEKNPELGYRTPQKNLESSSNIDYKSEKEEKHINWLLKKFPKLGDLFQLHKQIGEGTFSSVFMASLQVDYEKYKFFAIKHLVPTTHPKRIQIEFSCLQLIGGEDNVVGVDLCMRENGNIIFIMPYLEHGHFSEYVDEMDAEETALYIKNLLIALKRVHSFRIIHRDVKPNNFLYNRNLKKFLLVDFGLAQVCSSNSPLAKSIISKDFSSKSQSQKRKRDPENTFTSQKSEFSEPAAKRPALQKKNINSLDSTVSYLQNTLDVNSKDNSKEPTTFTVQSKENLNEDLQEFIKKSPFKTPTKPVSSSHTKIMKSPYKFTGLDLPSTHSKFQEKTSGQRRLFFDEEPKNIKFQKPLPSMTISSRLPLKAISPVNSKIKQIQQSLHEECKCYGKPSVCSICLFRKAQDAPRAGTPGFRPPEVLLKYPNQTTAVDIWAVGVILLCILSGTFPFFRAPDDTTALAEIITLFGDEHVKKVSKLLGQNLICSETKKPLDLRKVCYMLRNRNNLNINESNEKCSNCLQFLPHCLCSGKPFNFEDDIFPDSAYDLLKKLLDIDPYTRISAEDALKHPFLQ